LTRVKSGKKERARHAPTGSSEPHQASGKTMKAAFGLTGLVLATRLSTPAMAQQIDAGLLTCEACLAMDAADKAEATNAVISYVKDAANASTTGAAADLVKKMDGTAVHGAIDSACVGAVAGMTVPMALEKK
jgi:hypothetical protein